MTATLTENSLQELADYVRHTLPLSKTITRLELNEAISAITFHWQGRGFLVRKSLEVFEIRGNQVFVTGASMLMQSALVKQNKNDKVLGAVLEVVTQAEQLLGSRSKVEAGLRMLASAKASLIKLSGLKPSVPLSSFRKAA